MKFTITLLNHKLVKLAMYKMKKQINEVTTPINLFL